jgi:hypothetical protein
LENFPGEHSPANRPMSFFQPQRKPGGESKAKDSDAQAMPS